MAAAKKPVTKKTKKTEIMPNECYMLYIGRTFSDKVLRNFAWYRIANVDANSFCRIDDSYEIYADKNSLIARMEEVIRESVEQCTVGAIRTMVQAKWREWLI
jgi:hypothetical protein